MSSTNNSDIADVTETTSERNQIYGDFELGIQLEAAMMHLITKNFNAHTHMHMELSDAIRIGKIIMKLSRLSVSPEHIDSWLDIAGYATLVHAQLKQEQEMKEHYDAQSGQKPT